MVQWYSASTVTPTHVPVQVLMYISTCTCTKELDMKKTAETLNTTVTVFPNPRKVYNCYNITLGQWLNGCINPSKDTLPKMIEQIRATEDKPTRTALKLKLPGVVLGAVMSNRAEKDKDKIKHLTGLMPFDIDQQDNPEMDANQLKNELSKVKNVIFAALSASGKGVWGLVQVSNPKKHKEHFKQLISDFEKIGIKLDKSKGGNETDLRYYSYDPEAYLAESFKIYDRTPKPKPKQKNNSVQYSKRPFAADPIKNAVDMVLAAPDGEKHITLLKAARLLGGYVAAGTVIEHEAQTALENAIRSRNIESFSNAQKTISDGLKHGKSEPIYAPIQQPKKQHPVMKPNANFDRFFPVDIDTLPMDYIIKDGCVHWPVKTFVEVKMALALSGDKVAQNDLERAYKGIKKDLQLMQSEAGKACLPAPVADAANM